MAAGPGALVLVLVLMLATSVGAGGGQRRRYTSQLAVLVPGGAATAARVAARHGCSLVSQIGSLADHYLWDCGRVRKRSVDRPHRHIRPLRTSREIHWADQQYVKSRSKRDGFFSNLFGNLFGDSDITTTTTPRPARYSTAAGTTAGYSTTQRASAPSSHTPAGGPGTGAASPIEPTTERSREATTEDLFWSDPLFHKQWYLEEGGALSMHVPSVWRRGYTGRGVAVSILDDGIQVDHPELSKNYDRLASTDINSGDGDPTPRDDGLGTNRHGTRNAGVVAAGGDNAHCGVGVAPDARIGGIRMLDGEVTDVVEAQALSYQPQHIDIYSVSWGPDDDGRTLDGPGPLAGRAFVHGILQGRRGKGSIFVLASGNGGRYSDDCNCDGYNSNIFTVSISSATEQGLKPWYLEHCASTLATTYSSGRRQDAAVTTSDLDALLRPERLCTSHHTGTSASTAIAAGISALVLEANPELSWRDLQHLIVHTSRHLPLTAESGWTTNASGRKVSHKFGYGLMDALAMVELAERWTTVPRQLICVTPADYDRRTIPLERGSSVNATMEVNACRNTSQGVYYLEHVQCRLTLRYPRRGVLRLLLTSPAGTQSTLLSPRHFDRDSTVGFAGWPFMSVHFWGEDPAGQWTLSVVSDGADDAPAAGTLLQWQLVLYGTAMDPYRPKPRPPHQADPASQADQVEPASQADMADTQRPHGAEEP